MTSSQPGIPMRRRGTLTLMLIAALSLMLGACGSGETSTTAGGQGTEGHDGGDSQDLPTDAGEFTEIEWDDLVPAGSSSQQIQEDFSDRLEGVEDGTPEADALYEEMRDAYDEAPANSDLDGMPIRLDGFVAPLTYSGELITEFLLVPTFGACIHVPPPPANQLVLVTTERPYESKGLFEPVTVTGMFGTAISSSSPAVAARCAFARF